MADKNAMSAIDLSTHGGGTGGASDSLQAARLNAAIRSEGTSGDRIYRAVQNIIGATNITGTVLDYGAGTGTLTRWLVSEERFSEVHAADITPQPPGLSGISKWIEIDLNQEIPSADNFYDLVVAAEVIEHLENPRFVCREIFRLLRPGGLAIITTPNNEHVRSLLSLIGRGHFAAFTGSNYPAHITALLRCDLARILTEAGFESVSFSHSEWGSIPFTRVTWQQISFGMLRGKPFSDNLIVTARKPRQ